MAHISLVDFIEFDKLKKRVEDLEEATKFLASNCPCTYLERLSGHRVGCNAPEVLRKIEHAEYLPEGHKPPETVLIERNAEDGTYMITVKGNGSAIVVSFSELRALRECVNAVVSHELSQRQLMKG